MRAIVCKRYDAGILDLKKEDSSGVTVDESTD